MWYHPATMFGKDAPEKPLKVWRGAIPEPNDIQGNFIWMWDYLTYGSYHLEEAGWALTTHTVVGYPALASGMHYLYMMRVTV